MIRKERLISTLLAIMLMLSMVLDTVSCIPMHLHTHHADSSTGGSGGSGTTDSTEGEENTGETDDAGNGNVWVPIEENIAEGLSIEAKAKIISDLQEYFETKTINGVLCVKVHNGEELVVNEEHFYDVDEETGEKHVKGANNAVGTPAEIYEGGVVYSNGKFSTHEVGTEHKWSNWERNTDTHIQHCTVCGRIESYPHNYPTVMVSFKEVKSILGGTTTYVVCVEKDGKTYYVSTTDGSLVTDYETNWRGIPQNVLTSNDLEKAVAYDFSLMEAYGYGKYGIQSAVFLREFVDSNGNGTYDDGEQKLNDINGDGKYTTLADAYYHYQQCLECKQLRKIAHNSEGSGTFEEQSAGWLNSLGGESDGYFCLGCFYGGAKKLNNEETEINNAASQYGKYKDNPEQCTDHLWKLKTYDGEKHTEECYYCFLTREGSHNWVNVVENDNEKLYYCQLGCIAHLEGEHFEVTLCDRDHADPENLETVAGKDPTCTEDGYSAHTRCTNHTSGCEYTLNKDIIPATGHKMASVNAKAPTCTEPGYTAHEACAICGEVNSAYEVEDAIGHKDDDDDNICDRCGVPVCSENDHKWGDWVVTTVATCTAVGVSTSTCSACHETKTEEIEKIAHNYRSVVINPTCTEGGHTTHTCTVCGDTYTDAATDATGHNESLVVTPPTCTEEGYTTHTCLTCGHTYTDTTVSAKGHSYVLTETPPTCTDIGHKVYTCSTCSDTYTEEIPTDGHKYNSGEITKKPTCTESGVTTFTCTVCGHTYTEAIEATGHTAVVDAAKAPTCTETGLTEGSHCSVCGEVIVAQTEVAATGHSYNSVVTAPTCDKAGYTTHTCTACGDYYTDSEVAATGEHTYGNVAYTWSDDYTSCTATGTCSVCGEQTTIDAIRIDVVTPVYSSCTQEGSTEYTAKFDEAWAADNKRVINTDKTAHIQGSSVTENVIAATCTKDGSYDIVYYCTAENCGAEINRITVSVTATGHTAVVDAAVAPTCTETGLTEGSHCSVCDEILVAQETVDASGHSYNSVVTAPTCTAKGYTTHTCTVCGDTYTSDETPAAGHKAVTDAAVDASCTNAGKTEGSHCSVCGEILVAQETIPATGHTAVTDVAVAPTCTATGLTEGSHCSVCGRVLTPQATVPKAEHTPGEATVENNVPATCTTEGSYDTVTYCTDCGAEIGRTTTKIDKIAHNYNSVVTDPTCTVKGYTTHTCTVCGDTYTDAETEAKGHSYSSVVTDPTCTEKGYTTHTCTVCGDTYTDAETEAKGHSFTNATFKYSWNTAYSECTATATCSTCEKEVTLTASGEDITYESHSSTTCDGAGYITYKATFIYNNASVTTTTVDVATAAAGHKYDSGTKIDPTCTAQGYTIYKCTNGDCNAERKEAYTDPLGHSWNEGEVTTPATCTTAGVKTYTCSVCKETKIETIPATGVHTYEETGVVAPTCNAAGYTTYTCSGCGATRNGDYVDALGHKYNSGEITKKPTCTTAGVRTYTCEHDSNHTYTESIPATGHTAVTDAAVAATCTETGLTEGAHCKVCNTVIVAQQTVAALGHTWNSGEITTAATCTTTGVKTYTCTRTNCDETKTETIPAAGHTAVIDKAKAPTCTETGLTEGAHCEVCNAVLTAQKTLPATGHSYDSAVTAPTCIAQGYTTYTCSVCSDTYKANYVSATGHKYDNACDTDCNTCGAEREITHSYNAGVITTVPTCIEKGVRTYTCAVCNNEKTEVIDALGHTPHTEKIKINVVEATCTTAGSYDNVLFCTVCNGKIESEKVTVPATGHDWDEGVVTTNPTCTTSGIRTYTCQNDASHTYTEEVDALDHDYSAEWTTDVEPTCTTAGSKSHHCSRCDSKSDVTEIPALGHTYGATSYTWTGVESCTATRFCTVCKTHSETATGAITSEQSKAPTCTEQGDTKYTAIFEAAWATTQTKTLTDISATGHKDADNNHVCDNGCGVSQGTHEAADGKHTCDYCGETVTTCADGDKDHNCDVCGTKLSECADNDNDHNCDICNEKLTDCADNNKDHNCDICGDKLTECVDTTPKDHKCDICETSMGEHADSAEDDDHVCDYGCGVVLEACSDKMGDGNHSCDICGKADVTTHTYSDATCETPATCTECSETTGSALGHIDTNKDHKCDRNCGKTDMGAHADSATDADHVCDYGCGVVLEACSDKTGDGDHKCDICGKADVTSHTYSDATCETPATCTECNATTGEALGHSFTNYVSNNDATCTEDGTKTAKCDRCKATDTIADTGSKRGHSYGEWTSNGDGTHTRVCANDNNHKETDNCSGGTATCTERAICEVCETAYGTVNANNHVNTTNHNQIDATCTTVGYTAGTYCEDCDKWISGHTEIPVLGHKDENNDHVCDNGCGVSQGTHSDNNKDHICDYGCNVAIGTHADSDTDHKCDYGCNVAIGTCEDVNIKDHKCDYGCGVTFGEHADGDDNDHLCDYGCGKIADAGCYDGEDNNHNCDECGAENVTAHTYNSVVTAPTCTEQGYTTHTCTVCGDTYKDSYVKENGHSNGGVVVENRVDPTCTETGSYENVVYCTVCNHRTKLETVTVAAAGHSYGEWQVTTAATCTEDGSKRKDCENCDHFVTQVITATGHTEVADEAVAPTCTTTGLTAGSHCSVCGTGIIVQTVVPALGHTHGAPVEENRVEPTCTTAGSYDKVVYCTVENCKAQISRETIEIPSINHNWKETTYEWNVDHTACTATRVCDNDEAHVETVNATIASVVKTPATCTEKGTTTYTATFGASWAATQTKDVVDIAATGHKDADNNHVCDNGCGVSQGTHSDNNKDHICDYGCNVAIGTHADSNTDHKCDYGCSVVIGTCEDADKDHDCDYGCSKVYGDHEDTNTDHKCDYGCNVAIGTCEDKDFDHDCDYGCDKYFGTHADSAEDDDHVCDYGCGVVLEACSDKTNDGNHNCDICGKENVTEHSYTDKKDETHHWEECNCGDVQNKVEHTFANWTQGENDTHTGTCSCGQTKTESCSGGTATCTDKAICDVCKTAYGTVDANNHASEETSYIDKDGETHTKIHSCCNAVIETVSHTFGEWSSTGNKQHTRSCVCGKTETAACADVTTDKDHSCDICGAENVTDHSYSDKWTYDEINHWHECNCGAKKDEAAHTDVGTDKDHKCDTCEKEDITNHEYTAVVTAPTCTTDGYTTHTCKCGDFYISNTVSALNHTYTEWVVTLKPTCTDDGRKERNCSVCGADPQSEVITKLGHQEVTVPAVAPTCTETGLTEGKRCTVCSVNTVQQEQVPATGHTNIKTTEENRVEATCTTDGSYQTVKTCTTCGTELSRITSTLSATGHKWKATTYEWNVDHTVCTATRVCENDANHVETVNATITSVVKTPATCTEKGTTTYTAKFGANWAATQTKDVVDIAATGHDYVGVVTTAPTCTEKGVKTYTCQHDASHKYTEEVAALGHNLIDVDGKAATCTEDGYTAYKDCSRCDYIEGKVTIAATGHKDADSNHVCDNGCGVSQGTHSDNNKDHICDYGCNVTIGTHADSNTDHKCDYGCNETIGTCEDADKDHDCDYGCSKVYGDHEDTNTDHKCDYGCNVAIGTCEDADLDHDCDYGCDKTFGNHVDENKDHACDYGCNVAIGTHADSATDNDHVCDYGCGAVLEACSDKTNDGNHNCDICGKAGITEHTYNNAVCDRPATCTECGATTGEALGHSFTNYVSDGNATCTNNGTETAKCDRCNVTDTRTEENSALGHKDENTDHICDNGCGVSQGEHADNDKNHTCDYGCTESIGTHADSAEDDDHVCDYGCGAVLEECVDNNKDHACDNGCDKVYGEHKDDDKNHTCDYGCNATIGTCEDKDFDHDCDYGCDKYFGTHADSNTDHVCDYGCNVAIGTHADSAEDADHVCDYGCGAVLEACVDSDKDHACDNGCDATFGEHKDENKDHVCDYGCNVAIGTCEDADLDHDCDYGCSKVYGDHKDNDKNHACDYGCSEAIGTHADSATDNDHVCDYGCGAVLEECVDNNKDHACDNGCDKTFGNHVDENKDHACDYGCSVAIGDCEDKDLDHDCDYGCDATFGTCEDKDFDHDCDYGCDKYFGTHADSATDTDHVCDYGCSVTIGTHADSATDNDHVCDYGCGVVLEACSDKTGDGDHKCDICGEADITEHTYNNAVCDRPATCTECGATTGSALGHAYGETVYTWNGVASCTATRSCGRCDNKEIATAVIASEVTTYPTCTTKGAETYTAEFTENWAEMQTKVVEIDALGHVRGEAVVENNVLPTCTSFGSYDSVVYCTRCRTELSRTKVTVSKLDHTAGEVVVENKVEATCTADGSYDNVVRCTECNTVLSSQTVIVHAKGHTAGEAVIENNVLPTCTADGSYDKVVYCTVCDTELRRDTFVVDMLGHEDENKDHVCDNGCSDPQGAHLDGDDHDHLCDYGCGNIADEGCHDIDNDGNHNCDECDAIIDGHTAGNAAIENKINATCTADGHYDSVVYCVECDAEISRDIIVINRTGHKRGEAVKENVTNATCTAEGSYESVIYCIVCDAELKRDVVTIPMIAHTAGEAVVENYKAPSCVDDGHYDSVVYCVVCSEKLSSEEITINSLGHTAGNAVIENYKDATCTAEGTYDSVVYCVVCREELSRVKVEIPLLNHTFGEVVVENNINPTCITEGSYDFVIYCTECNAELIRDRYTVNRIGHIWGNPVVENEVLADCENAGSYDNAVYCRVCEKEVSRETVIIDAHGHTSGETVVENIVDPTCTHDGSYDNVIYCTTCDDELSRKTMVVDSHGHKNGAAVKENEIAPDCTHDGRYDGVVYCDICNEELIRKTVTVDAFGHDAGRKVVENKISPDCENEGSYENVVYCDDCGEELSRELVVLEALGHDYNRGECGDCGTEDPDYVEPQPPVEDEDSDKNGWNDFFSNIIEMIVNFLNQFLNAIVSLYRIIADFLVTALNTVFKAILGFFKYLSALFKSIFTA